MEATIPQSILDKLTPMIRQQLVQMDATQQEQFVHDFRRKSKSMGIAYLFWFLFGLHYAYLGKWTLQILFWLTAGGLFVWALIDLFPIPKLVRDHNEDVASDVLRNIKAMAA